MSRSLSWSKWHLRKEKKTARFVSWQPCDVAASTPRHSDIPGAPERVVEAHYVRNVTQQKTAVSS